MQRTPTQTFRLRSQGLPWLWGLLLAAWVVVGSTMTLEAQDARTLVAQAAPPKSPPAAVRQFRDAVAFQDRGVYDLAADEWEKFLKQFPRDPLMPKAQHYLGVCRLLLKDYPAALKAFEQVIANHPQAELTDASYQHLGLTQYSLAQAGKAEAYDQAARTFSTLVEKFPQSKHAGEALYYLGESLYARGQKPQAIEAYTRLIKGYPDEPLRPDALYALGVALQDVGKPAEAIAAYDQFLQEFAQHTLHGEILMRRAEALFSQSDFVQAERGFHAAAAGPGFALADLATLREAASLFEQKKIAEAAALYATIPDKFPKSTYRAAAILAAGNCYYLLGNLPAAEDWLKSASTASGQTGAEAAHWLARVYLKTKRPAEALQVVEKTLPAAKDTPFGVSLLLDRADAVYDLPERRREAIALYAALASEHPQDASAPQALYMAAFTALETGDYPAAGKYAEQFLQTYAATPLAVDVGYVAAEAALQLKDYARADAQYRALLEKHPTHADAPNWLVRRALAQTLDKRFADVVATLAPAIRTLQSPELTAHAQYLAGTAQLELQQFDAAQAAFTASLAAQPKGAYAEESLLGLAAAQRQQDQLPSAIATLRKLTSEFPQGKLLDRAYYRLGEYLAAAGDLDAAGSAYAHALKTWPESPLAPHARYRLAWTQLNGKDYPAANETLTALVQSHPEHPLAATARYARALARERLQDFAGAGQDLAAFLATNPTGNERLDALYVQGLVAAGLKQFDQAAGVFRSILAADPDFSGADKVLYELAWALRSAGQPKESLAAFEQLARQHPESPLAAEALFHVGESHYLAKEYAEAATNFAAAKSKPGTRELAEKAAHKLGWSLYQQGKFAEAADVFAAQLADFPQGELAADARFMQAEALFSQQQYDAALEAYAQVSQSPLANAEFQALAALHAGQALAQQKKWQESLALLESAISKFPQSGYLPEIRYEAAWAQQNLGQLDQAMARYEQVVAETEREVSARARFMIGEILFEKQDYKEAIRNFFKVAYGYGYPQAPEAMRVWQANAAYEAGRCFEVLKMTDQAKKSYQEVVDKYPQSDKASLAKSRLEALGA